LARAKKVEIVCFFGTFVVLKLGFGGEREEKATYGKERVEIFCK